MSYQVLARKWRPRAFADMAGQEHVLKALIHALDQGRLHHAYLFTGTRGVGKTTLGRIIAKCLNCEQGVSSQPCGQCSACQAIDSGRFVDLLEIDAASRTKVEDTRDLLDNVQYAPTQGRYKIYLIDEVHMLSGHSFNALLKTLEEPPEHVKFILATTDPQKLPITVLSRCLQFHLKNLTPEIIQNYLHYIVKQEQIMAEPEALKELAVAANGSMRDALSLLDQSIAYGSGEVKANDARAMLGNIDQQKLHELLSALAANDAKSLISISHELSELGADFTHVLEALLTALHEIALMQHGIIEEHELTALSQQLSAENVQLYYQIALKGRQDLALAPNPKIGFDMVLLRMHGFTPAKSINPTQIKSDATHTPQVAKLKPQTKIQKAKANTPAPAENKTLPAINWLEVLPQLGLKGMALSLAQHCQLKSIEGKTIHLIAEPSQAPMISDKLVARLQKALSQHLNDAIILHILPAETTISTPAKQMQQQQDEAHQAAHAALHADEQAQTLINEFDGRIKPETIKPLNDNLED